MRIKMGRGMNYRELLLELRKETGLSQIEFAKYFKIPLRTLQDWEYNNRRVPVYLLRLMIYKLENEKLVKGLSKKISDIEKEYGDD